MSTSTPIKRILTLALSAALMVSGMTMTALAAYAQDGGDGESEQTAYIISTPEQLALLAESVNSGGDYNGKYYRLAADIDLSGYGAAYAEGKGWTPIGTTKNAFRGHFDGSGYAVTGLYINDDAIISAGLFGVVDSGTVQNLNILDANITGKFDVGGISGAVRGGYITNCRVTGEISGKYNVGGVTGYVSVGGSVTNCRAEATISGGMITGGAAGGVFGNIADCCVTGSVSGSDIAGGIAGFIYTGGSVTNCTATSDVSGYLRIGGAAGRVDGSLANCRFTGTVSGDDYAGAVAGQVGKSGSVINCEAQKTRSHSLENTVKTAIFQPYRVKFSYHKQIMPAKIRLVRQNNRPLLLRFHLWRQVLNPSVNSS